ncbi:hypothetical protein [Ornithinicoccus hortensis]|uniref:Calcineurin-like phosphoesterase domain-containing protein n=1 Tax=Ornithinicoccus hortensis TaxID=82346 RepID=A0A542YUR6_9MICO|nr:hypothetical protein [Ornithinicoccus hortensis]TQL51828.1 hypothetical protein FB467_2992 [Ornithinicoccus hortensis]
MATKLLVVSGLHLDKAWTSEQVAVGHQLRAASSQLLLELVQRALDLEVDALVVLGGLWDPATVRGSTVDDVRTVLDAVPFPVVLLPDRAEAESGFRPESLVEWPATVHLVESHARTTVVIGDNHLTAVGPLAPPEQITHGVDALLTTQSGREFGDIPVVCPASSRDAQFHGTVPVPVLIEGSGTGHPQGIVVMLSQGQAPQVEEVTFSVDLGTERTLDVSEHEDSSTLISALNDTLSACAGSDRLRVSGRVNPRVLVPPALKWTQSRPDVTVVWEDLDFVFPPTPPDHTVQAELIRRLAGPGPDAARRHQALALGLDSLESQDVTA